MSFQETNSALTQAYLDIGLPVETFYEGMPGDPPKTGDWAVLSIIPATNNVVSLGVGGEDEEQGIMQIDLYTEQGHSTDKLLTWANAIQTAMVAGSSFVNGSTTVWIGSSGAGESVVRTPIRPEGGWMRIVVSVYYQSRFERPVI